MRSHNHTTDKWKLRLGVENTAGPRHARGPSLPARGRPPTPRSGITAAPNHASRGPEVPTARQGPRWSRDDDPAFGGQAGVAWWWANEPPQGIVEHYPAPQLWRHVTVEHHAAGGLPSFRPLKRAAKEKQHFFFSPPGFPARVIAPSPATREAAGRRPCRPALCRVRFCQNDVGGCRCRCGGRSAARRCRCSSQSWRRKEE